MDVLEIIKLSNIKKQPNIIIVTALNDKDVKSEAKEKKANAFVTKPIQIKMVRTMLDHYLSEFVENISKPILKDSSSDDDFFDPFEDFDDDCPVQDNNLVPNNTKISAKEFLKNVDNIDLTIEQFNEIEFDLYKMMNGLEASTLKMSIPTISETINMYASVLSEFVEFYELSMALRTLENVLNEVNFNETIPLSDQEKIAMFIKAMLNDLINWLNHVFVIQDSIDVFYINDSISNSCVQLENMIKSIYDIK